MDKEKPKSNVEAEFTEIDSKNAWPLLYQHIRSKCQNYGYTFLEAKKSQNKNLNRYRDVSPYDHSRVILSKGSCDYINANLLTMEKAHRKYILTQGPLPNTSSHFWLMVWEQNCKAVLMLNKIIEKNQIKCHQYWPMGTVNGGEDTMVLNDVHLEIQYVSESEASYYTTRILRLTDLETGSSREILHFHYTTWPDFGVPQSPTAFLRFLMVVRKSGALDQNVGPPVIHCSAGIGRSGTFCLVDSCLVLIEEKGLDSVNVIDVLLEMRKFRMGLIQTPDQLRFSYQAIIEGAKLILGNSNGPVIYDTCEKVEESNSDLESKCQYNNVISVAACRAQVEVEALDEIELDDTEPPQPPARNESLPRPSINSTTSSEESTTDIAESQQNGDESPSDEALPMPPMRDLPEKPTQSSSSSSDDGDDVLDDDEALDADDDDDDPPMSIGISKKHNADISAITTQPLAQEPPPLPSHTAPIPPPHSPPSGGSSPSRSSSAAGAPSVPGGGHSSPTGLRKRPTRKERTERLEGQIREIRRKQRRADQWRAARPWAVAFCVGASAFALAYYYFHYYGRRT